MGEIFRKIRSAPLKDCITKGETFVARVRRIGESAPEVETLDLEQKIGAAILDKVKGTKVSLTNPSKTFFGVLTGDRFVFGLKLGQATLYLTPFVEQAAFLLKRG